MQISISVPGRFHAFELAEQLLVHDELDRLFIPDLRLETTLPDDRVDVVRHAEFIGRLEGWLPVVGNSFPFAKWRHEFHDRHVAKRLDPNRADLFVGFSHISTKSIERGNELDLTTVVERCSSHIETQAAIIEEEFREFGIETDPVPKWAMERELTEYRTADYVMTPSTFVRDSFLDRGVPAEKVWMCPFAVDPSKYTPKTSGSDTIEFLFAGRVGLRKGVQYLLEAWSQLNLPDAKLRIAGEIESSGEFLVERYGDDPTVEFLGWVSEMKAAYRSASAFVFPTLEEGSAYVTYEAMASGLPILTTPHSGWVGTDGEHGIEVPIRDVEALVEGIERLYDDQDERRSMGAAARDLVESSYTWHDYGERVRRAYRAMLAGESAEKVEF
jgi:glycosyltransferase involved in cell wall biosynthesis